MLGAGGFGTLIAAGSVNGGTGALNAVFGNATCVRTSAGLYAITVDGSKGPGVSPTGAIILLTPSGDTGVAAPVTITNNTLTLDANNNAVFGVHTLTNTAGTGAAADHSFNFAIFDVSQP